MVALRPILPPLPQGFGVLQRSWTPLKQEQVVQGIQHVLLLPKAAFMVSQHPLGGSDLDMERIGFQDQLASGLFDGHRVAIGLIGHLAVSIEMNLTGHTAVKRPLGQRTQKRLLALPSLSNADGLPINHAHVIAKAMLQYLLIQFLEGGHARHGHQIISPAKPHRPLHTTLLMPLRRGTKMGVEEVVTAKGDEGALFFSDAPLYQRLDSGGKIVITQAMRDASKELEGTHVPVEEGFLLLRGKGHDKRPARVGQMHHEELYLLLLAFEDDLRLSPIHLGILSRLKFERQKGGRSFVHFAPADRIYLHSCLAASISLRLDQLKQLVGGVALFLGQTLILSQ